MAGVPVGPNELAVAGNYFPTIGPVRLSNITVPPNPVLFGDTTRASETQVMGQVIQSSTAGGGGVYRASARVDIDRFWTSSLDTRYRNQVMLPPRVVDIGLPAGLGAADVAITIDYRNEQYFAFANKVYRWLDSVTAWSAMENSPNTLPSAPTSAVVFNNELYFAYGVGYSKRDAAGVWTNYGATAASLLLVWDNKLWRLANTGSAWTLYSSSDGIAWGSANGTLSADITPTQLIVFRDAAGASVIYVVTDRGLWIHDSTNGRLLETEVRYPRVVAPQRPRAVVFRDGKLYVTTGGLGMLSVQGGNPVVVSAVGLDLEDGVPPEERTVIGPVVADYNWLIVLTDATLTDLTEDEYTSGLAAPLDTPEWSQGVGVSTLRFWNQGWHKLWSSSANSTPGYSMSVSSAYDKRRLWWGAEGKAFYMDLPTTIHNPRQNPTKSFAPGPLEHTTPWLDLGNEGHFKINGHLSVRATGCSADETITVYYGTDLNDSVWTLLGTITSDGYTTFDPGGPNGIQLRHIRFKFALTRGGDTTKTPILEYWVNDFMRVLPAQYGYSVQLDLSQPHRGKTPAQLLSALRTLSDPETTPGFVEFSYQDMNGPDTITTHGRISRLTGEVWANGVLRSQGSFVLSWYVPYKEDDHIGT